MLLAWYYRDLPLRAAGVVLLLGAALCWAALFHDPAAIRGVPGWLDVAEAACGFLGGSIGLGLAMLGRHIHDRIAVSARWT